MLFVCWWCLTEHQCSIQIITGSWLFFCVNSFSLFYGLRVSAQQHVHLIDSNLQATFYSSKTESMMSHSCVCYAMCFKLSVSFSLYYYGWDLRTKNCYQCFFVEYWKEWKITCQIIENPDEFAPSDIHWMEGTHLFNFNWTVRRVRLAYTYKYNWNYNLCCWAIYFVVNLYFIDIPENLKF